VFGVAGRASEKVDGMYSQSAEERFQAEIVDAALARRDVDDILPMRRQPAPNAAGWNSPQANSSTEMHDSPLGSPASRAYAKSPPLSPSFVRVVGGFGESSRSPLAARGWSEASSNEPPPFVRVVGFVDHTARTTSLARGWSTESRSEPAR